MSKLRGVAPTAVQKRPKMFLFGPAGSHKTNIGLRFPSTYLIDTEKGAENDQYRETLNAGKGAYFHTADLDEIIDEAAALLTVRHAYRTFLIDPITIPYVNACEKAAVELARRSRDPNSDGYEFGRNKAIADRKMKRLCGLLLQLDMNVILTSHQKTKWEKQGEGFRDAGTTFDAYGKLDYLFDLVLETQIRGTEPWAVVRKSRVEAFPLLDAFPLNYEEIVKRYGRDVLERGAEPVVLATPEQVARLTHLVEVVKIDPEVVQKWLDKANAESFAEMPAEAVGKCIAYVEGLLNGAEKPAAAEKPTAAIEEGVTT